MRILPQIKQFFCYVTFRLQFFARGVQGYMKKLRESLQGKNAEELKSEENRIKVTALRTTSNINTLIRDLFRNPPSFKASVTLSFKPAVTSQVCFVFFLFIFCFATRVRHFSPRCVSV